tara:strand:+ start:846 stop:1064 length:219 start_codon:yes stop_codon:yes gene_type:complete
MYNQNKKITGYRYLSQEEIDIMNEIKELAVNVGMLIEKLDTGADQRWLAIGKKDLQTGFMALTRSVAKPEIF